MGNKLNKLHGMVDSGTETMGNKHKQFHGMVDSGSETIGNKNTKLHGMVDSGTETMGNKQKKFHGMVDSGSETMGNIHNKLHGMVDSGTETMEIKHNKLYGDHEIQVSEGGEADLHKHLIGCNKNPGHTKFIPVDTFNINHLPEGHRDKDLYEYIKVTAGLTVRVDVKMTSQHRPELFPGTKDSDQYRFYNIRDKIKLKTGSGMVSLVYTFRDGYRDDNGRKHKKNYTTCWCKQCQHSDTASHVWWEFYVLTATQVSYDNTEPSHTSLRLFYDREDSPVVSVDQVDVDYVNNTRDMCWLYCVTCDKNLGDKLDMLWRHYVCVCEKVRNKYRESRDVDKLNFIVSHPHGCCKQVSVGHLVDKYKVDGELKKFTYTTCTCPGSSGAIVHCLGYDVAWSYQLVHSGSFKSKLNYSGAGYVD